MEESPEAIRVLTNMYREKARDAFINGLNGDMPRLLAVKEPKDLPHSLHLCEILENQQNFSPHNRLNRQVVSAPLKLNAQRNTLLNTGATYNIPGSYYPQLTPPPLPPRNITQYQQRLQPTQFGWNTQQPSQSYPTLAQPPGQPWPSQPFPQAKNIFIPSRPVAPKPLPKPEPMDVDRSMQSKAINYMNRPGPSKPAEKRPSNTSNQIPYKAQRNFHIESEPEQEEMQQQGYDQEWTPTMDEYETALNNEDNLQLSQEYEQTPADFTDIHF